MEQHVRDVSHVLIPVVDAIGALVISIGVLLAFATWALSELRIQRVSYERVRLRLGRFLALGSSSNLAPTD